LKKFAREKEYRDSVFAYIEKEDTQRPLLFRSICCAKSGFQKLKFSTKIVALRRLAQFDRNLTVPNCQANPKRERRAKA